MAEECALAHGLKAAGEVEPLGIGVLDVYNQPYALGSLGKCSLAEGLD
jgi:hypothetical protein